MSCKHIFLGETIIILAVFIVSIYIKNDSEKRKVIQKWIYFLITCMATMNRK
ncbi:hypothetical protein [Oceanobacillus jeddahense]|uniref:Uncharacterized protein n=1 Tax=Oceanobacillus jeddahense TaxID=1462527 RepID=A0ABY5K1A7_9BACI|nr:hypothetical protein [Oceanobacillus jeddahense]UUI05138.1 hypothetical protein NP439_11060 [Oceanobacillus jeddahense]